LRDHQSIENEVAGIFSDKLNVEVSSYDLDLFEGGILDSLQLVELLFQLEQQFGARISLDSLDLDDLRSIERIAVMLARQNGRGNGT
jgi:D-alanine--poly(phosphoribitol) ligase subunit 2